MYKSKIKILFILKYRVNYKVISKIENNIG